MPGSWPIPNLSLTGARSGTCLLFVQMGSCAVSNYGKGRRFEYEVAQLFEANGFIVTRAASSKGPWDLVAVKKTPQNEKKVYLVVVFAQCKVNKF